MIEIKKMDVRNRLRDIKNIPYVSFLFLQKLGLRLEGFGFLLLGRRCGAILLMLWADAPQVVSRVAEKVLAEANRLSDTPWTMRALMKKARLPRFGKALGSD